MSAIVRRLITFSLGAPVLAWFLLRALAAGPPVGTPVHPGAPVVERSVSERHTLNAVGAIVFDYRGYDTLGEEFVLFAAVLGVSLLLRETGQSQTWAPEAKRHDYDEALEFTGYPMLALTVIAGLVLAAHGHLTPGGGFQGGAIIASALALAYLLGGPAAVDRLGKRERLDVAEALGVGAFAALALGTVLAGRPMLTNVLPLGTTGALLSSGTIFALNLSVALAVTAGFSLVVTDFLREDGIE
jgi:multicomponent Na+:H+ antiporter subunit B